MERHNNIELTHTFFLRVCCPYCGTGFDEIAYDNFEEAWEAVQKYLHTDEFVCWDCEQELEKRVGQESETER